MWTAGRVGIIDLHAGLGPIRGWQICVLPNLPPILQATQIVSEILVDWTRKDRQFFRHELAAVVVVIAVENNGDGT